jgi:hypothetical protein
MSCGFFSRRERVGIGMFQRLVPLHPSFVKKGKGTLRLEG